jgi:hypothetical protein
MPFLIVVRCYCRQPDSIHPAALSITAYAQQSAQTFSARGTIVPRAAVVIVIDNRKLSGEVKLNPADSAASFLLLEHSDVVHRRHSVHALKSCRPAAVRWSWRVVRKYETAGVRQFYDLRFRHVRSSRPHWSLRVTRAVILSGPGQDPSFLRNLVRAPRLPSRPFLGSSSGHGRHWRAEPAGPPA